MEGVEPEGARARERERYREGDIYIEREGEQTGREQTETHMYIVNLKAPERDLHAVGNCLGGRRPLPASQRFHPDEYV